MLRTTNPVSLVSAFEAAITEHPQVAHVDTLRHTNDLPDEFRTGYFVGEEANVLACLKRGDFDIQRLNRVLRELRLFTVVDEVNHGSFIPVANRRNTGLLLGTLRGTEVMECRRNSGEPEDILVVQRKVKLTLCPDSQTAETIVRRDSEGNRQPPIHNYILVKGWRNRRRVNETCGRPL